MANAQALTAEENLHKGSRSPNSVLTRKWQRDFFVRYTQHIGIDFLLTALPASGKTRAALTAADRFLKDNHPAGRLIVVSPTLNVRGQWKSEALANFSLQLLTSKFEGHLNDSAFHGVVTTYQTVANQPLVFKRLCNKYRLMVIFDEIHHAADRTTWGESLKEAFESAAKRLALSGTPFRSDGEKIPFLTVEGDMYHIDFPYDYPQALEDGVIREICFHRYSGSATFQLNDEVFTLHTNDEVTEDDAARRLRGLLGSRNYMCGLLTEAHEKLLEVRRTKPEAGGLILCQDANHAVLIRQWLADITGVAPDRILSDDDLATCTVNDFRKDAKRLWAVAVRQVSEGVDVKRLMVLVYATNWRTELFFRQAIGRIMRYEGTDYDTEAYCFLPKDPELMMYAERIEEFQAAVLSKFSDDDDLGLGPSSDRSSSLLQLLASSEAEFDGLTNRGQHYDQDKSQTILDFARRHHIPEATATAILEELRPIVNPISDPADNEVELAKLARQCGKQANKLARARGCEPKEVHIEWIRLTNCGHAKMTLLQFRQKLEWLNQQLREMGW